MRAPNANAHLERWVGSIRRVDRLLIVGSRQLEDVLRVDVRDYNRQRPHRALDLQPPDPNARKPAAGSDSPTEDLQVRRRDLLGGLIHEHEVATAA